MAKKLFRSRRDKWVAGVCGGVANYFGVDATVVRALFAVATVVGVGSPLLIYAVLIFVIPRENETFE